MNFDRIQFWKDPTQASNELRAYNKGKFVSFCQPGFYINQTWGQRIVATCFKYMKKDWSILELGCNTGKTLAYLVENGFEKVMGVEINQKAIDLGRKKFPLLKDVEIICSPLEDVIKDINCFDMIYAGGVFMHLPYELDWVFEEISNHARHLIMTAENEMESDFYKFERNYKKVFAKYGWQQMEEESGDHFPPIPASTVKRIFVK